MIVVVVVVVVVVVAIVVMIVVVISSYPPPPPDPGVHRGGDHVGFGGVGGAPLLLMMIFIKFNHHLEIKIWYQKIDFFLVYFTKFLRKKNLHLLTTIWRQGK